MGVVLAASGPFLRLALEGASLFFHFLGNFAHFACEVLCKAPSPLH
jgi:hypothetical protein